MHNEQNHILACLRALSGQIGLSHGSHSIVLFLNNCCDQTSELVSDFEKICSCPIRVISEEYHAPTAGWARQRAMDAAAAWLDEAGAEASGVILTTDADSVVPPDWIARNLAAFDDGADAVAGRIVLDQLDAACLPASLHARGRLEATYEALLTEIGARLDPSPGNVWPTHWTTSGATLAVTRAVYGAVGGMPALVNGEDRAFANRILAQDFRLRHEPGIVVSTSGRLVGRAAGGAAETMAMRCAVPDSLCDDRLETFGRALARVLLRRRLRRRHMEGRLATDAVWKKALGLSASDIAGCLAVYGASRYFGAFYAMLETTSARLSYRPLPPSRLNRQIVQARAIVTVLRVRDRLRSVKRGCAGVSANVAALPPTMTVIVGEANTP